MKHRSDLTKTNEEYPYKLTDDGEFVIGREDTYWLHGGPAIVLFVPEPSGPSDGWPPGAYESYMRDLNKKSLIMMRKAARQQYGAKDVQLASSVPATMPKESVGVIEDNSVHVTTWRRDEDE